MLCISPSNIIFILPPSGANIVGVLLLVELLKLSHPSIVDQSTEMVGFN